MAITGKIPGNNQTCLQFSKHVATEAFQLIIPVDTTGGTMGQNMSVLDEQEMRCPPLTEVCCCRPGWKRELFKARWAMLHQEMNIASQLKASKDESGTWQQQ